MNIKEKVNTYKEDLARVQQQRQELEQLEQRLTGAVLALQELQDSEDKPDVQGEVVEPAKGDGVS